MNRAIEKVEFSTVAMPKPKMVCAYARVSNGKDAMLHSLSAQVSYYIGKIQSHPGWQYCGVYADEAVTGTKDNRENFKKMIDDCRAGKIDLILTKSVSRFARNTVTLLKTVRELKELGVDVFFEEQNIFTLSSDGELMMTILASYAQEESFSASENQKWRVRKAFENGELMNLRYLFGYDISKDGIKVNPEQAEIVREIYKRAIAGESFASIARSLSERNIRSVFGNSISGKHIRDSLDNEKYTGNALLMKRFKNNHIEKLEKKNRGERPMYYAEGTHEAIIDMETFEKAQEIIKRHAAEAAKHPRTESKFTRMIVCENCGAKYKRCTCRGIKFWECSTTVRKGKVFCGGCRIHEDMLSEITDATAAMDEIDYISAGSNILTYHLKDGRCIKREWQTRSRADSWSKEMKEKARQTAIEQWRKQNGKNSNVHSCAN